MESGGSIPHLVDVKGMALVANERQLTSDNVSLANEMIDLYNYFNPKIFGGCCGTDKSHMEEIAKRLKKHQTVLPPI